VFRGRPAADARRAVEALLQAGIPPDSIRELGPPLAKAGAAAQAFELYSLLGEKLPAEKLADLRFSAWKSLRASKGAQAAEAWLRKQGAAPSSELATFAYAEGLDAALWDAFPDKPGDAAVADRLTLLRAASIVRRGERGARRDALVQQLSDRLAWAKAKLARSIGLAGAHMSWELRLARYVLGLERENDVADDATDGARPCEAPYYFGVRAAAETRRAEAATWFRVALECRNPGQPEFAWAWRAAGKLEQDGSPPTKLLQASR